MQDKRNAFLSHIVKRRLDLELQRWTAALNQRFDVAILCPSAELQELVTSFLERNTPLLGRVQQIRIHHLAAEDSGEYESLKTPPPDEGGPQLPTIYVCHGASLRGCGAIAFELPGLESLLPSAANMVITLLESAGLERFIDAFDGRKMSQLKKILDSNGVEDFSTPSFRWRILLDFGAMKRGQTPIWREFNRSSGTPLASQVQD